MVSLLDSSLKLPMCFQHKSPFKISYTTPKRSIYESIQRRRFSFTLVKISNSKVINFLPRKAHQLRFFLKRNAEVKLHGCVYLKFEFIGYKEWLTQCQTFPWFACRRRLLRDGRSDDVIVISLCETPERWRLRYFSGRNSIVFPNENSANLDTRPEIG